MRVFAIKTNDQNKFIRLCININPAGRGMLKAITSDKTYVEHDST